MRQIIDLPEHGMEVVTNYGGDGYHVRTNSGDYRTKVMYGTLNREYHNAEVFRSIVGAYFKGRADGVNAGRSQVQTDLRRALDL